ncbi:hypothetical protein [Natrononativus amylolyticus]|uniref:hypothetical protein n=1 Tax=Natrononativus amylolyticus TaxID=2963434 RepID=UPI0020CE10E1|nr:hypothetical protein [Natrononativus amylolyticus]
MNRRAFLASVPAILLAGCATRLGLAERDEIAEKRVVVGYGDSSETLVRQRYDGGEPYFDGEGHELFGDVAPDDRLEVSDELDGELRSMDPDVRYEIRGCAAGARGEGDCREAVLVRDDFNDVDVGDIVDLRYGDPGAGVISVHRRREKR